MLKRLGIWFNTLKTWNYNFGLLGLIKAYCIFGKYGNYFYRNSQVIDFKLKKYNLHFKVRRDTTDRSILSYIVIDGEYDILWDKYWLEEEPEYIIDAGANIGIFSAICAIKYPHAKIIAVEPEVKNFEMLKQNVRDFPNVKCIKAGIWDKNTYLKVESIGNGEWGFVVKEMDGIDNDSICSVTMEDLWRELGKPIKLDIVKMDIEGSELQVFRDKKDFWIDILKMLVIETHEIYGGGGTEATVCEKMHEKGFEYISNKEDKIFRRRR